MGAAPIRRAEILMLIAYATDLATGRSRDFALRSCVVAMRFAEALGLSPRERFDVYHQALLRYVGCNADTDLLAHALGDEIQLRRELAQIDLGNTEELTAFFAKAIARRSGGSLPESLSDDMQDRVGQAIQGSIPILIGHCEVAQRIGTRLGLPEETCANLGQIYERWDGRGFPNALRGEAVSLAVRIVALCQDAMVLAEGNGIPIAIERLTVRGEAAYGPGLVEAFAARVEHLLRGMEVDPDRATVLALEPRPHVLLDAAAIEDAFMAIADMVDMRMPYSYGHSRAVAKLAEAAGRRLGLPESELRVLRWAALVHDLGELAVPVADWLQPSGLSERMRDEARLHPYRAERALTVLSGAAPSLGPWVARHHERLDGSGYHRGARAADLPPAARLLAAAEAFQTAREERPHRPARSPSAAAAHLRTGVHEGRLCPLAVEAVLASAGQPSRRATPEGPGGLTPRESEVLGLIARGLTTKEVASRLGIAAKTADNHVQNLYSKLGVGTRAGAVLYAVEHGLIQPESALA